MIGYTTNQGLCDFCSPAQPAVWDYPAKSFRLPYRPGSPPMSSEGGWLACKECAEAIEADDRVRLANRATRSPSAHWLQRELISRFVKNRIGERVPFG